MAITIQHGPVLPLLEMARDIGMAQAQPQRVTRVISGARGPSRREQKQAFAIQQAAEARRARAAQPARFFTKAGLLEEQPALKQEQEQKNVVRRAREAGASDAQVAALESAFAIGDEPLARKSIQDIFLPKEERERIPLQQREELDIARKQLGERRRKLLGRQRVLERQMVQQEEESFPAFTARTAPANREWAQIQEELGALREEEQLLPADILGGEAAPEAAAQPQAMVAPHAPTGEEGQAQLAAVEQQRQEQLQQFQAQLMEVSVDAKGKAAVEDEIGRVPKPAPTGGVLRPGTEAEVTKVLNELPEDATDDDARNALLAAGIDPDTQATTEAAATAQPAAKPARAAAPPFPGPAPKQPGTLADVMNVRGLIRPVR